MPLVIMPALSLLSFLPALLHHRRCLPFGTLPSSLWPGGMLFKTELLVVQSKEKTMKFGGWHKQLSNIKKVKKITVFYIRHRCLWSQRNNNANCEQGFKIKGFNNIFLMRLIFFHYKTPIIQIVKSKCWFSCRSGCVYSTYLIRWSKHYELEWWR